MHRRSIGSIIMLAAALALAACSDSEGEPFTPPDELDLAGTYAALIGGVDEFGAILFQAETGGAPRDLLAEGASIAITLRENGTTAGRLFVPDGDEDGADLEADLSGTWRLVDGAVVLDHEADTFLRDLPLEAREGRLVGDGRFGGARVELVLDQLPTSGGFPRTDPDGLEVEARVEAVDSDPSRLVGTLRFTNPGSESVTLEVVFCVPRMRAYLPGEDEVVWDQLEEGACDSLLPIPVEVGPGGSVELETFPATPAEILDDELPSGTYRMTVYLRLATGDEIEVDAGTVELAIALPA